MKKIALPSSKSISNRALILAALSDKPMKIRNLLESDDTQYLREVLRNLGVKIEAQKDGYLITPPLKLEGQYSDNFIGNAGTAARFCVGLSLVTEGSFSLRGVDRMHERPFADLFKALESCIDIEYEGETGFLPVTLNKKSIPTQVTISGSISSQFITALLLVGAKLPQGLTVNIEGDIPSLPYIQMTLEMLKIWGITFEIEGDYQTITIHPGIMAPADYTIPPDMSAASVPLALSLMMGESWDLDYEIGKTLQGDEAFKQVIEPLLLDPGCRTLDFESCPDVSMTGMVLAAVSPGKTTFTGLESLRVKECDRIEAMREGLTKLGFEVSVGGDDMTIVGNPAICHTDPAIRINAYDDHRIAFCFGILLYRLGFKDVRDIQKMILKPECVSKTWPDFWLDLATWTDQLRPVSAVVMKRDDTYLLVEKPRKENAWQFPQGGVDPGETGLKAARRELSEECGDDLEAKWIGERSIGSYEYFFPDTFKRHDQNITGAHVSFYQAVYIGGEVIVDGEELVGHKWLTPEEIRDLVTQEYWEAIKNMF